MTIYSVYVVNRAGGLIYHYDHTTPVVNVEKTFSYPLDVVFKIVNEKITVDFGERDGIKVGHTVLEVNGTPVIGQELKDGGNVLEEMSNPNNFPMNVKFGRPKLTVNEKLMLASMFHSFYAIGSQLSPEEKSSGIKQLDANNFTLHCHQTLSGVKFIVVSDPRHGSMDVLFGKLYEIYADFALKNPFHSIDMPIRCDLFDDNLKQLLETAERPGGVSLA